MAQGNIVTNNSAVYVPRLLDGASITADASNLVIKQGDTIHVGALGGNRTMTIEAGVTYFKVIDWGGLAADQLTITLSATDGIVLTQSGDAIDVALHGAIWSLFNYRGTEGHTQIS